MEVKTRKSPPASGPLKHSSSTARAGGGRRGRGGRSRPFARTAVELRLPAVGLEQVEHAHEQVDGGEDDRDGELGDHDDQELDADVDQLRAARADRIGKPSECV